MRELREEAQVGWERIKLLCRIIALGGEGYGEGCAS